MWFRQVDRSSDVRLGAVDIEARYTLMRSYDGTAPIFALGAPLLGIIVIALMKVMLPT